MDYELNRYDAIFAVNNLCEPNEFKCPNGQCVMKIWRCDGEDDCSDGFDERNCGRLKLP